MSDVIRVGDSEVIDVQPPSASPGVPAPALPAARHEISIRPGVLSDYPFIDALQKANKRGVGFMWEKAIKGHIEKGNLLVAEATGVNSEQSTVNSGEDGSSVHGSRFTHHCGEAAGLAVDCSLGTVHSPRPVGYVLGVDRYLKRDELGVIYQMCVVPEYRRSLVAANLLKAKFERSAYGCRLYCCWCAQDLAANRFWEAMGFVPLAFRTGGGRPRNSKSKKQPRMHIFWQKRIREGDTGDLASGGTPFWFPSMTGAGAIAEDRLVLPIPPGTHWSDAKPVVLPEGPRKGEEREAMKLLEDEVSRLERERRKGARGEDRGSRGKSSGKPVRAVTAGGLHFGPPGVGEGQDASRAEAEAAHAAVETDLKEAKKALRREKKKFDPAQVAFARELKDRWLEQVQAQPGLLAAGAEKYAVRRQVEATKQRESTAHETRRLDAA